MVLGRRNEEVRYEKATHEEENMGEEDERDAMTHTWKKKQKRNKCDEVRKVGEGGIKRYTFGGSSSRNFKRKDRREEEEELCWFMLLSSSGCSLCPVSPSCWYTKDPVTVDDEDRDEIVMTTRKSCGKNHEMDYPQAASSACQCHPIRQEWSQKGRNTNTTKYRSTQRNTWRHPWRHGLADSLGRNAEQRREQRKSGSRITADELKGRKRSGKERDHTPLICWLILCHFCPPACQIAFLFLPLLFITYLPTVAVHASANELEMKKKKQIETTRVRKKMMMQSDHRPSMNRPRDKETARETRIERHRRDA